VTSRSLPLSSTVNCNAANRIPACITSQYLAGTHWRLERRCNPSHTQSPRNLFFMALIPL
jgi:hypothetical protein